MDAKQIDEWNFIGGDPVLDFINTVEDFGGPMQRDFLPDDGALVRWGVAAGLIEDARLDPRRDQMLVAGALRDTCRRIVRARTDQQPIDPSDLRTLADFAAQAYVAGSIEQTTSGEIVWNWPRDRAETIVHALAVQAVALLAEPTDRLGHCPGDNCGWYFLDTTKRGNRRWCSMRECGQVAKSTRRRKLASSVRF